MTDEKSPAPADSEYEREPVPPAAQKGHSAFWGMYAGEHTAGTEFMIGPLFVAWGVSANDLLLGLLVGNVLAVLTWRFVTAPLACHYRLTLYYLLEKIAGPNVIALYNLASALLFCFLAGAMVTVSATAVGPLFPSMPMPNFTTALPTGLGWMATCAVIGSAMTLVAMRGYATVALVGKWAAPWMFLVFLSCALVVMGKLGEMNLWKLLEPAPGTEAKVGFWGVVFFAWFCNAAMHLGMADLSVLRFARQPSAGWASAAGMFLGHYIAWICAALLLIYWVRAHGVDPAVGKDPGTMVNDAVGWAGLICIIIAGWTTANPTIYRAGLALQSLHPRLSRTTATVWAGAVCTVSGMFPAFAMRLLDFVGLYGAVLSPIGAVIIVHHFFGRSRPYVAGWSVAVAWLAAVALALLAYLRFGVFAAFLPLPCALLAGCIYLLCLRRTAPASTFIP